MLGRSAIAAEDAAIAPVDPPALMPASGVVMLDYQSLKVRGYQPIDLVGFHYLNRFNDWLYAGVGGHAPLVQGNYGGFMSFDATLHAEKRLFGNVSALGGISLGGGGGGRDTEQSKIITGSGGFMKTYVGLGYRFDHVTTGVTYSHIRFTNSAIDSSQWGLFVQLPVSYSIAPYESAGRPAPARTGAEPEASADSNEDDSLIFGSDNIIQLSPKGSNSRTVNLVDVQYDHFFAGNYYALFGGSVGYHGIAGYNQAYGGLGYRYRYSKRVSVDAQLAIGSGGYSPDSIDTGSGLLIFPKVSAEYRFNDELGLSLSSGYLYAAHGTSRNLTLGAALVYHADARGRPNDSATPDVYRGHRVNMFLQTEFKTHVGDHDQGQLKLLTVQVDTALSDRVYVPVQGSIGYDGFLGYPGYGEVLAGLGLQSRYAKGDSLQGFAQILVGTNIYGAIVKPAFGLNATLGDGFALYGQVGTTDSLDGLGVYPKRYRFRSITGGLGLTYRFSTL